MLNLMISQALRLGVKVHCRIELSYKSEDEAEKVLRAVVVDNEGFVQAKRRGSAIVSNVNAKNILALLHTIEDYLACVSVAEKAITGAASIHRGRAPPRPYRKRASRRGS